MISRPHPRTPRAPRARPGRAALPRAAAAAVAALALLAGCGGSELAGTRDRGFVSSTGSVVVVAPDERRPPGEVAGETLDGGQASLAELAGSTVVLPVWGSWCGPCRKEAPALAAAARELAAYDVAFLGINSRDENPAKAQAFVRTFDIPYPSLYDPDGDTLLAFSGSVAPNAIPSIVVVDAEGRVAAVLRGEVSVRTLYGVVEEVSGVDVAAGGAEARA